MRVYAGRFFASDDVSQPFEIVRTKTATEIRDRTPANISAIVNPKTGIYEQSSHPRVWREERDALVRLRHLGPSGHGHERDFGAADAAGYDQVDDLWAHTEIDQGFLGMRRTRGVCD